MKTHVAQNDSKTRRAVVNGRRVQFFRRRLSEERYTSPYPVWHDTYPDHKKAVEAADFYAKTGNIMFPRRNTVTN